MAAQRRTLIFFDSAITPELMDQALASLSPEETGEIVGLFIEDTDILGLARLPVAREICYDDLTPRALDVMALERQFRARAARIRAEFERRVRSLTRSYSFQIARGPSRTALIEACTGFDVLLVTGTRHRAEHQWILRQHMPGLLAGGPGTLIVVRRLPRPAPRVAVLIDGSPASEAALRAAAAISRRQSLGLTVLLVGATQADQEKARQAAQATIGDVIDLRYQALARDDPATVAAACTGDPVNVLVLPRDGRKDLTQFVVDILDRLDCSVIVTR